MRSLRKDAKKPSKKIALEMIRGLREQYDNECLDDLILFFSDRQKGIAKTAEQWVCRAVATKDIRHYLNYMYVEDGQAYGTDGHRAHTAPTSLADGYYAPASLEPVDMDATFPNVQQVLKIQGTRAVCTSINDLDLVDMEYNGKLITRFHHKESDLLVSNKYIKDAVNGDNSAELSLYTTSTRTNITNNSWYGESKFGRFVVMGVNR